MNKPKIFSIFLGAVSALYFCAILIMVNHLFAFPLVGLWISGIIWLLSE